MDEGAALGMELGVCEGWPEGCADGILGLDEGAALGMELGVCDGWPDGCADGIELGA